MNVKYDDECVPELLCASYVCVLSRPSGALFLARASKAGRRSVQIAWDCWADGARVRQAATSWAEGMKATRAVQEGEGDG